MQSRNTHPLPSNPLATQDCDFHPHKGRTDLSCLFAALSLANLAFYGHRVRAAARSFRGHIGILFSTRAGVPLGPALQLQPEGYRDDERTYARAEGIRTLQATHPWVDNADLQIFLMGFDAGEAHCIAGTDICRSSPETHRNQNV